LRPYCLLAHAFYSFTGGGGVERGFLWFGFGFARPSHYVVQTDLKLVIFLLLPPECWNYRHVPPCPTSLILMHSHWQML
jgi:hypothetical protein